MKLTRFEKLVLDDVEGYAKLFAMGVIHIQCDCCCHQSYCTSKDPQDCVDACEKWLLEYTDETVEELYEALGYEFEEDEEQ